MIVRPRIEVKTRREAAAISRALKDPEAIAFLIVLGELESLPSDRSRRRVLNFIADQIAEDAA